MRKSFLLFFIFIAIFSFSQKEEKVYEHFRATRIINLQSVESLNPGILELKISHRFGAITEGPSNLFGLDIATMRIALEQGVTNNLMAGIGRSTTGKVFDGFLKWRFLNQKTDGSPITASLLTSMSLNSTPYTGTDEYYFSNRLAYVHQVILSTKLNDRISLQLSPTIVHKNLVTYIEDKNTTYALGFASKYNMSKVVSLNLEYIARLRNGVDTPTFNDNYNSLSCGVGIDTRGHFFELHLTNSFQMVEKGFITETNDTWSKGNIHVGFNIVRDFKIYKKK